MKKTVLFLPDSTKLYFKILLMVKYLNLKTVHILALILLIHYFR